MKNVTKLSVYVFLVYLAYGSVGLCIQRFSQKMVTKADEQNYNIQNGNMISENKCIADGVPVVFTNKIVSGFNLNNPYIYVQDNTVGGNASGMRVYPDYQGHTEYGAQMAMGKIVDVSGYMSSWISKSQSPVTRFERYVSTATLTFAGTTGTVKSMGLTKISDVGGRGQCVGTPGETLDVKDADSNTIAPGTGINTRGMVVKVTGKVTYIKLKTSGQYSNVFYVGTPGQYPNDIVGSFGTKVMYDKWNNVPTTIRVGSFVTIRGVVEANPIYSWVYDGSVMSDRYIEMFSTNDIQVWEY